MTQYRIAIQSGPCAEHLAIVEQVRDGTQLRVRLLLDDQHHQFVNLVSFDPFDSWAKLISGRRWS